MYYGKKEESAYSNREHRLHQWHGIARSVGYPHAYRRAPTENTLNNTANATVQFQSPRSFHLKRCQALSSSIPGQSRLSSLNNVEFQRWPLHFLALGRTGLFSTGTEQKLGFTVPKTSYCCSNTTARASLSSAWTRYLIYVLRMEMSISSEHWLGLQLTNLPNNSTLAVAL